MNIIYAAHSGLRYLVLLLGVCALVWFAIGWATNREFGRPARILGASYVGTLHLQILLGLVLLLRGIYYPALNGHLVLMLVAAAAATLLVRRGRRASEPGHGHAIALAGVVVSLLLIVGGIMSIGRGVLDHAPMNSPPTSDRIPIDRLPTR